MGEDQATQRKAIAILRSQFGTAENDIREAKAHADATDCTIFEAAHVLGMLLDDDLATATAKLAGHETAAETDEIAAELRARNLASEDDIARARATLHKRPDLSLLKILVGRGVIDKETARTVRSAVRSISRAKISGKAPAVRVPDFQPEDAVGPSDRVLRSANTEFTGHRGSSGDHIVVRVAQFTLLFVALLSAGMNIIGMQVLGSDGVGDVLAHSQVGGLVALQLVLLLVMVLAAGWAFYSPTPGLILGLLCYGGGKAIDLVVAPEFALKGAIVTIVVVIAILAGVSVSARNDRLTG